MLTSSIRATARRVEPANPKAGRANRLMVVGVWAAVADMTISGGHEKVFQEAIRNHTARVSGQTIPNRNDAPADMTENPFGFDVRGLAPQRCRRLSSNISGSQQNRPVLGRARPAKAAHEILLKSGRTTQKADVREVS